MIAVVAGAVVGVLRALARMHARVCGTAFRARRAMRELRSPPGPGSLVGFPLPSATGARRRSRAVRGIPVGRSTRVGTPSWCRATLAGLVLAALLPGLPAAAADRIPVVVDLDIGDDIDDAFALGWLLASPAIDLRGITTAWGDTALRARLVERLLRESGHAPVPVVEGIATLSKIAFSQARWASGPHRFDEGVATSMSTSTSASSSVSASASASTSAPASTASPPSPATSAPSTASPPTAPAIDFLLDQARRHPGEITLLALGPLTNVAAAIRRDREAFGQFRQVVMMGGSVRAGYGNSDYQPPRPPDAEYNIVTDVAAAQTLFESGVPIVMMPLDSTGLRLDDQKRAALFAHGSALTDALTLLYEQWTHSYQPWTSATPTLFDVVPVAWVLDPALCPTTPLRIVVDSTGMTREAAGAPNARVCLASDKAAVLDRLVRALLR